jgi:ATP-dependent helicase/nuclease subunit B
MPVQFVLGRAGSGKTEHLLNEMIARMAADPLGPPIYWLLPRQATFEGERLLTARLKSFSRVRVVSFDQLGKEILIHCGAVDVPEVTTLGRRMVIGHLLRRNQNQLKYYSASAHRPGLAAELDSTFGEFDRAGLDSSGLNQLLKTIESDDRTPPGLADKLSDLHLLLDAYDSYIGQDKLDPARRLSLILKRVADCSLLKDAQVFVDDFYDFTAHERAMITAIAEVSSRMVISLLIDGQSAAVKNPAGVLADLSPFHRTERTYQSLLASLQSAAVPVDPPVLLRYSQRYTAAGLAAIEQCLFTAETSSIAFDSIECIEAADLRGEVDAVARRIKSAIASGLRYRQIGVLVRDLSQYQQIISASFAEHGLPFFADHRRTAGHHPLLQMVRAMLQIARHGWPTDAVMVLAKSGLAGLTGDQADELENYVLRHRIRGRMWEAKEPWMFQRDLIESEDEAGVPVLTETDRIDQYRRLLLDKIAPLLELGKAATSWPIREIASRLFSSLESLGVRSTLLTWMEQSEAAGDLERRGEHEQVWSEFVQLFDHMVDLLGDQKIALADFMSVLDSGLESFDLALTPPKVDQILVGQIDRTRPPGLKVVFVLGLNEGTFPRSERERCVISDRERRTLRARHVDLDHDSDRRLLDERFLAYLAFTRASDGLVISRTTADERGRPTNASGFWQEILRLIPGLHIQRFSRDSQREARNIGTQRQLVTSLLRWARAGADDADPLWPALYQWMAASPTNLLRDAAWSALVYDNSAHLDAATARSLFPSPLIARVAQLETMAECPFRHFARYGLKLHDREAPDVTGIDLSNAYHDILENLVGDLLQTKTDWCSLQPADAREMIRTHAAEIGRRLRGELMLSSSRNRYLLDRIGRMLEQSVAAMCEVSRRGKYRPTHAALRFGQGQTLPAYQVVTPRGEQLHLQGQIDRVDMNAKRAGFVLIDYKMAAGPLSLQRVYHGLSLQLLTYLLVIQANGEEMVGRPLTPAAGFLLQLLRSPQPVDHPSEGLSPDDPDFHLRVKPRGIVDQRAIKSLDITLVEGHSKVIGAYVNKSGELGYKNISDVADQAEFESLLLHVEQRLGELADQIFAGDVTVAPYMMAGQTPCSRCEYRSVCRFEPGVNRYRMLPGMKREEVLGAVRGVQPS